VVAVSLNHMFSRGVIAVAVVVAVLVSHLCSTRRLQLKNI